MDASDPGDDDAVLDGSPFSTSGAARSCTSKHHIPFTDGAWCDGIQYHVFRLQGEWLRLCCGVRSADVKTVANARTADLLACMQALWRVLVSACSPAAPLQPPAPSQRHPTPAPQQMRPRAAPAPQAPAPPTATLHPAERVPHASIRCASEAPGGSGRRSGRRQRRRGQLRSMRRRSTTSQRTSQSSWRTWRLVRACVLQAGLACARPSALR